MTSPLATFPSRQRTLAELLVVVAIVASLRYAFRTSFVLDGGRVFSLWDDAMISMRFARHLAEGHGLAWNVGGEAVQGFTNFGLVIVMAVLHLIPVSVDVEPLLFQVFCALVLGCVVVETIGLVFALTEKVPAALLGGVLVASYAPLFIWGIQGADSAPMALAFVSTARQVAETARTRRAAPLLFFTLAAGVLVRLDFVPVGLVAVACVTAFSEDRVRALRLGLGAVLGTAGALLAFGQLYFGDPLPNTFYLRTYRIPVPPMIGEGIAALADVTSGRFRFAVAWVALTTPLVIRASKAALFPLFVLLFVPAYFVRIGGDWATVHGTRFLVPAMPVFFALAVAGAVAVAAKLPEGRRWVDAPLVAVVALGLAVSTARFESLDEYLSSDATPWLRAANESSVRYARYLCRATERDTTLGVFWGGVLPYHCERPVLDLLGKADRHIAKMPPVPFSRYWPGHAKRDWSYVIHWKKPDVLLGDMPELRKRADYRATYCDAKGGTLGFLVRAESRHKLLEPGLAFCAAGFDDDICRPCGLVP